MSGFEMAGYKEVVERIADFKTKHPEGCLRPADPSKPFEIVTVDGKSFIAYAAAAYRSPDDPCPGIGVAWEPLPGLTKFTQNSELQNAETSAWGRAIVAVLASESKSVASADEVRNRQRDHEAPVATSPSGKPICAICEKVIDAGAKRNPDGQGFVHKTCVDGSRDAAPRVPDGGGGGNRTHADAATLSPCRLCDHEKGDHTAGGCTKCHECPGYEAELSSDRERELFDRPEPEPAKAGVAKAREKLGGAG